MRGERRPLLYIPGFLVAFVVAGIAVRLLKDVLAQWAIAVALPLAAVAGAAFMSVADKLLDR